MSKENTENITTNPEKKNAFGILKKYANPSLIKQEEKAFETAMIDKHKKI